MVDYRKYQFYDQLYAIKTPTMIFVDDTSMFELSKKRFKNKSFSLWCIGENIIVYRELAAHTFSPLEK